MNISKQVQNLSKKLSGKIYYEYDMKRLNWFNLGGPAKVFFKPNTLEELIFFLKKFSNSLPIKILGVGSNTLIRNGGYDGVIIKLGKNFSHLSKLNDNTVISGSAVLDKQLSNFALENSVAGLEFLSCIPGSIGGAIRMNSGCYDYDISKCIASIQVINRSGIVRTINSEKIKKDKQWLFDPFFAIMAFRFVQCIKTDNSFNASISDGKHYNYKQINLGITIDVEDKLLISVLSGADQLTFFL